MSALAVGKSTPYRVRCPYCYQWVRGLTIRNVLQSGCIQRYDAPVGHLRPDGSKCLASLDTQARENDQCQ